MGLPKEVEPSLCLTYLVFLLLFRKRGVWGNTAYHTNEGLFLHSIAERVLIRSG